jgi:radical SAM protein with 4Fe4S-binding SPASM domain
VTILTAQRPRYCVLELTLACNVRCVHCGSAAGAPRKNELTTDEMLRVIDALASLGCESVTLSGGEPLMRNDWPVLARAIQQNNMKAELITNGLLALEQSDAIAKAEFSSVTFSVDGPTEVHDRLRHVPGGLARLLNGAKALANRGVPIGAVTQVNKLNLDRLDDIHDILVAHAFKGWQVQLTIPNGRAAEPGAGLCLEPRELLQLEVKLIALYKTTPLLVQPADNIGYMSRNEPCLRTGTYPKSKVWTGCQAGLQVVGITSDGTVRGCLSMPPQLDEGSVRERTLSDIWNDPKAFAYNREARDRLSDECARCAFGNVCRGGCKSLAFAVTGNTSFNPFCLSRLSGEYRYS